METCRFRACHRPQQPLRNYPSGSLEGWATPLSAQQMLDGQHQRMDIPTNARTAYTGLLQKTNWKRTSAESPLMFLPPTPQQPNWSRDWTEHLNFEKNVANIWALTGTMNAAPILKQLKNFRTRQILSHPKTEVKLLSLRQSQEFTALLQTPKLKKRKEHFIFPWKKNRIHKTENAMWCERR